MDIASGFFLFFFGTLFGYELKQWLVKKSTKALTATQSQEDVLIEPGREIDETPCDPEVTDNMHQANVVCDGAHEDPAEINFHPASRSWEEEFRRNEELLSEKMSQQDKEAEEDAKRRTAELDEMQKNFSAELNDIKANNSYERKLIEEDSNQLLYAMKRLVWNRAVESKWGDLLSIISHSTDELTLAFENVRTGYRALCVVDNTDIRKRFSDLLYKLRASANQAESVLGAELIKLTSIYKQNSKADYVKEVKDATRGLLETVQLILQFEEILTSQNSSGSIAELNLAWQSLEDGMKPLIRASTNIPTVFEIKERLNQS